MVVTVAPWAFYLCLSLFILGLSFVIGWGLYRLFKNKMTKKLEGILAFFVAIGMIVFYLFVSETFTDRASFREKIITKHREETIQKEQVVIIPFSRYVVIERLYEYGYVRKEQIDDEVYQLTFQIENGPLFLDTYDTFVTGDRWWSNEARFSFQQAYEKEWKKAVENDEKLPGLKVRMEKE